MDFFIFRVARTNPGVSASTGGADDVFENIAVSDAVFRRREADETINGRDETTFARPRRTPETGTAYSGSNGKRQNRPGQKAQMPNRAEKAQMTGDRHDQGSFGNHHRGIHRCRPYCPARLRPAG
jgi:hypothetical protein